MDSKGYRKIGSYTINPTSVTPANTYGTLLSKCQSIQFVNPVYGTEFNVVDGIVCELQIDTDGAKVHLSGSSNGYSPSKPISVTGSPSLIDVSVPAAEYQISGNAITTADLSLTFATAQSVQVTGPATSSAFTIANTPAETTMSVTGRNSPDIFVIPELSTIIGSLYIQGGVQKNGANQFDLNILLSQGTSFTYMPGSVVQAGIQTHSFIWANVDEQNIYVSGTGLQGTVISPAKDTNLNIYIQGEPGGVNVLNLTGCQGNSNIRVYASGGGMVQINLGSGNQVAGFFCVVWIFGSSDPEQTDSVTFQSGAEETFLKWDLSVSGSMVVRNPTDKKSFFTVFFEAVDQMTFELSKSGNQIVAVGTSPTEMHFKFPAEPAENSIHVISATNAILVSGMFTTLVGPDRQSYPPMTDLGAPVIFIGDTDITMNSGTGLTAASQHYDMDESCLNFLDSNGATKNLTGPSDWMCNLTTSLGLPCRTCQIQYQGRIGLWLTAGGGNNTFIGHRVQATVNVSFDSGRDTVLWADSNYTANFDVSQNSDNITLIVPISPLVQIWLGRDSDVDTITFYPMGKKSCGWDGLVLTHTGTQPDDKVVIYNYFSEDRMSWNRQP